jgi:methylmalonyl-CoA/ethylmalonyl-CoA epimerase
MPIVKRIDHVAIAVKDIESALTFWQDTLGLGRVRIQDVPDEEARSALLPIGGSAIELVEPTTDDSGLARFLAKRGPGLHHICLEVDDLAGWLAMLKEKNVPLINETPVAGADGRTYAFIHPRGSNGILVELYQLPE